MLLLSILPWADTMHTRPSLRPQAPLCDVPRHHWIVQSQEVSGELEPRSTARVQLSRKKNLNIAYRRLLQAPATFSHLRRITAARNRCWSGCRLAAWYRPPSAYTGSPGTPGPP